MKRKTIIFTIFSLIVFIGIFVFLNINKTTKETTKYHCPMHPDYVSDKPGDCPICGMKLVPIEDKTSMKKYEHEEKEKMEEYNIISHAPVDIIEQKIGVVLSKVELKNFSFDITTYGTVAYDPELYTAIDEYIETLKSYEKLKNSKFLTAKKITEDSLRRIRIKLNILGLSKKLIKEIERNKKSLDILLLGKGTVWIYADVYEYESSLIKVGQKVIAKTVSYPDKEFSGRVISIKPIVENKTRTIRIIAEVDNKDNLLKPNMFVTLNIKVDKGKRLTIVKDAVINTGKKNIAFLRIDEGKYKPIEVKVGLSNDMYYEVISGLNEGDIVAASANFLIDSESRIRASVMKNLTGHHHN